MNDAIFPASKMGFGCMRLPLLNEDDPKSIDLPQFEQMVDLFMAAGSTYFDTAFVYHEGESEVALGKALVARYPRDSFTIATKCLAWAMPTKEAAQECLDVSLKRLGTDHVDYFLLHNLGGKRTAKFDEYDMWNYAQQQKAAGKVRYVGLSLHDDAACLDELLTAHLEMDFVQLQVNYLDWDDPHNEAARLMEVARAHGKPVIVMEPLRGGLLANPPETVRQVLQPAEPGASCASWALRFAASQPGVLTVLSGMSDLAQMRDNIATMQGFAGMTPQQLAVIEQAQRTFEEFDLIPCTACEYCAKVCPANIGISGALLALNAHTLFGDYRTEWVVGGERRGKSKPSACLQCGACEAACPQRIPIVECLEKAARDLDL